MLNATPYFASVVLGLEFEAGLVAAWVGWLLISYWSLGLGGVAPSALFEAFSVWLLAWFLESARDSALSESPGWGNAAIKALYCGLRRATGCVCDTGEDAAESLSELADFFRACCFPNSFLAVRLSSGCVRVCCTSS